MQEFNRFLSEWMSAGEASDAARAVQSLSENVVMASPMTDRFVFRGRAQVQAVLESAFARVSDIRYSDHVVDGSTAALFYQGTIAGIALHEAQLLKLDDQGRIAEMTLFMRSLPALTKLMAGIGPDLARRQGQKTLARVIDLTAKPLHGMVMVGEKRVLPRMAPKG